ncbi:hypothetical protein B6I21_08675 [candidate division KSB1 bacterium 4572_119]|nr:MAG: hypothetical protein B6I21_08675 [candidate division KSB1 bacterium 4572_119]
MLSTLILIQISIKFIMNFVKLIWYAFCIKEGTKAIIKNNSKSHRRFKNETAIDFRINSFFVDRTFRGWIDGAKAGKKISQTTTKS